MSNYILINEDGSVVTKRGISDSDKYASDLGVVDIINIQGPVPSQYVSKGNWEPLEEIR